MYRLMRLTLQDRLHVPRAEGDEVGVGLRDHAGNAIGGRGEGFDEAEAVVFLVVVDAVVVDWGDSNSQRTGNVVELLLRTLISVQRSKRL